MEIYLGKALPELADLLGEDVCAFAMLSRIVKGRCTKTVTDHKRAVMCLSVCPFPVWVWVAPDAGREELERVWETLREEFPPEEGYSYNVGLPLSKVILESDPSLRVTVGLMAYCCHEAIPPRKAPGGEMSCVRKEEIALAAQWYGAMHRECALNEEISIESASEAVAEYMSREAMLFWRNESGAPMAMCGVDEDERSAYITHVYTPLYARRKGYAGNLVYAAAKAQLERGKTPMLYTDADYAASNACYTQIGFELQGEVRTVARGCQDDKPEILKKTK